MRRSREPRQAFLMSKANLEKAGRISPLCSLVRAESSACYNFPMQPQLSSVEWEAPEHYHEDKRSDWYWALGILTLTAAVASFLLGNPLFGVLIILAGIVMALLASREPPIIPFAVTTRGIRVGDVLYPYSTLESYHIETEHSVEPLLIVKSERLFMPLIIIPLPGEYIDEVESIVRLRLRTEHLEEPFATKLLEFFGF